MVFTVLLPTCFPSAKDIAKVCAADVVVWADSFVFQKGSSINRLRIKTVSGPTSLTIPVLTKGKGQQQTKNVLIDNQKAWQRTFWKNIQNNYKNSPYYFYFEKELACLYNTHWDKLNDFLESSFFFLKDKIGLKAEIKKSSELPIDSDRTNRVLKWAEYCGCDTYLVEKSETGFIDKTLAIKKGLLLQSFLYQETKYHQQFGGFEQDLSTLDMLFNEGEMARFILSQGATVHKILEAPNE